MKELPYNIRPMMTVKDVVSATGFCYDTILKAVKSKKLPCRRLKPGGAIRFCVADVEKFTGEKFIPVNVKKAAKK